MLRRVEEVCRLDTRRITGGTFHHVAHQILREHGAELGYQKGYSILDREDSRDVMTAAIADCGLAVGARRFPKARRPHRPRLDGGEHPDAARRRPRRPAPAVRPAHRRRPARRAPLRRAEARAERDGLRRPAPQLEDPARGARERPARGSRGASATCSWTSTRTRTGCRATSSTSSPASTGTCASWATTRSASTRSAARTSRTSSSSRSATRTRAASTSPSTTARRRRSSALANASIAANVRQFEKELTSVRARRARCPRSCPCRDVQQQAAFVAQRVLELRDEGIPLPEIAVLYRAHHHAMEIQFELARRGIPFVVRSGVRFFEAAHVKDVLAHLRFVAEPRRRAGAEALPADRAGRRHRHRRRGLERVRRAPPARRRARWTSSSRPTSPRTCRRRGAPATGGSRSCSARSRASPPPTCRARRSRRSSRAATRSTCAAEFLNADSRVEDLRQLAEYARGYEDTEAFLARDRAPHRALRRDRLGGRRAGREDGPLLGAPGEGARVAGGVRRVARGRALPVARRRSRTATARRRSGGSSTSPARARRTSCTSRIRSWRRRAIASAWS